MTTDQEPPKQVKPKFDLEEYLRQRNEVLRLLFPDDKDLFEIK